MQNDVSQFVVNIIPLQNIQTNISGVDPIGTLSNTVANLQEMVNYETKTIFTDAIQSFTANQSINILSPLNLSNVGLESNGIAVNGGSNSGIISTSGGSIEISTGQINFVLGSTIALGLTETDATFSGVVYGQSFVTLSDKRVKSGVEEIKEGILGKIDSLRLYEYSYRGEEKRTVGLLAQEVKEVFPLAVREKDDQQYIEYNVLLGYIIKSIQEIKEEIENLKHINLKN